MARVSVIYDESLKKQVFMVRGDERYARSTSTLLELGQQLEGSTDFSQELIVNVLRDKGEGSIVLYDNDDALEVINDWNSQSGERTILLEHLAYDVDYNFKATYMGNDTCNRSSSKVINVNVENKNLYDSSLTTDILTQFDPEQTNITANVTLSALMTEYIGNQTIEVKYDGTVIETTTTDLDGVAQFTIPNVGTIGKHNIQFTYYGSEHLTNKILSVDISVGYYLEVTGLPSVIVNGQGGQNRVYLRNMLNQPVEGVSVNWINYANESDEEGTVILSRKTNSSGFHVFRTSNFTSGYYGATATINNITYSIRGYVPYVLPSKLDITTSEPVLSKNNINVLTIQTNSPYENTKVYVRENPYENEETGEILHETSSPVYTNSSGIATYDIIGSGKGGNENLREINVLFGDMEKSLSIGDYAQYWNTSKQYNEAYYTIGCNLLKLSSVLRIQNTNTAGNTGGMIQFLVEDGEYNLELRNVTSNKALKLMYCEENIYQTPSVTDFFPDTLPSITLKNATIWIIRKFEDNDWKVKVNIINGSNVYHYEYSNENGYVPTLLFFSPTSGQLNVDFKTLALWRDK